MSTEVAGLLVPRTVGSTVLTVLGITVIASIASVVRTIWFHPLSKFPGSKVWAATRITYVISLLRGTLNEDTIALHRKYGDVVRIAPNELSFGVEEGYRDIYANRPGHKEITKDPQWYITPNDMPENLVTTSNVRVRARMRRLLSPSFSAQSLRDISPVLESFAATFLKQVGNLYDSLEAEGKPTVLNMTDWVNFFTVDIIGDLALGESFHCLQGSDYHPWVKTLFNFIKGMVLFSAARFFPVTEFIFKKMVPAEVVQKQKEHTLFTNAKISQRLESKSTRPDFMTPFLKEMARADKSERMTLGEIQSTFAIIIVAGSETTATSILGTLFKMAEHPAAQEKLFQELSKRFQPGDKITVAGTSDIPYLDGCINEGIRLCYAIPGGLPRVSPEGGDYFAGHFVPEGYSISVRPIVIFRNPRYFARPNEYHPERWLVDENRNTEFAGDSLTAFQPFSAGPTNCIGKPLAWAEMRLLIGSIVWNYELALTPTKPFRWEDQRMMIVVEKKPLWLTLKRRAR